MSNSTKRDIWLEPIRILLIDDSEETFLITRHMLGKASTLNPVLEWASTPEQGLEKAADPEIQAFLVDYELGETNGLELIRRMRAGGDRRPTILFTGKGTQELDLTAVEQGADDYLDKVEQTPALLGRALRHAIQRYRDAEERRVLQAQIQRLEKKKSIEVLAGGVAHNFNNILMIISGNADVLEERVNGDAAALRSISHIHHAVQRAAELTRHLLSYSDHGQLERSRVSAAKLAENLVQAGAWGIPSNLELALEIDEDIPEVQIAPAQLEEVFQHLVVNAVEAIEDEQGRVQLRLARRRREDIPQEGMAFMCNLGSTNYLAITVKDDGKGMDDQTQSRIFDPFFTTKSFGRGLGLSSLLGVVLRQSGAIRVHSEPASGTEVTVYLPAASARIPGST